MLLPVALLSSAALAVGCGGADDDRDTAARAAAAAFERALAAEDTTALCAALAPGTRDELEASAKAPCTRSITAEELPAGGAPRTVDVYGRQARVVLDADTLFLSRFPGGWKVVAAGCRPDGADRPYKCAVKGG
ncbi:hypothetical protein ACIHCQ_30650 [Streptomyces sp. NPDC052236]|uniref:hypothetical protein n=1 Tax=Streptomyces sp. NPDC052236 TaxID=3365686 RepID=UPI0037D5DEC9